MRFVAILSSLVCSNGLILYILIEKDDTQVITILKKLARVINYA